MTHEEAMRREIRQLNGKVDALEGTMQDVRADVAGLVELWQTGSSVLRFVKIAASFVGAVAGCAAAIVGLWLAIRR